MRQSGTSPFAPLWIVALLPLLAACAPGPQPGRTPRETLERFERSVRALELGDAYGLLTPAAQSQTGLTAEILDDAATTIEDKTPALAQRVGDLQFVFVREKRHGERTVLTVRRLFGGRDVVQDIAMTVQDGRWSIADPVALMSLPVPLRAVAPCFT